MCFSLETGAARPLFEFGDARGLSFDVLFTVESGHQRDQKSVLLIEVSAYGRLKM